MVPPVYGVILLCIAITADVAVAWVAPPLTRGGSSNNYWNTGRSSSVRATIATPRLASAAPVLPNPFQKLPWNVRKEQEREARRLKLERVKLHRQLGIAEDATYEEIVFATDRLIAEAGSNMKQKVLVEVAKDKILQYRLSERLAGYVKANAEARAQSVYELEGYVLR
jgi:Protein CHAPERONE-LIKE PROTEIN OF POR1-like